MAFFGSDWDDDDWDDAGPLSHWKDEAYASYEEDYDSPIAKHLRGDDDDDDDDDDEFSLFSRYKE